MKDKRLDVFFEHCSFRLCKYFVKGRDCSGWCAKTTVKKTPINTNCSGDIAKCELEG